MHDSGASEGVEVIEGELIAANTPLKREKRLRLNSIREVRRELTKLYRDAKVGRIATQDASRLTFMLQALSNLIKDDELEQRVIALEAQQNEKSGSKNH